MKNVIEPLLEAEKCSLSIDVVNFVKREEFKKNAVDDEEKRRCMTISEEANHKKIPKVLPPIRITTKDVILIAPTHH